MTRSQVTFLEPGGPPICPTPNCGGELPGDGDRCLLCNPLCAYADRCGYDGDGSDLKAVTVESGGLDGWDRVEKLCPKCVANRRRLAELELI